MTPGQGHIRFISDRTIIWSIFYISQNDTPTTIPPLPPPPPQKKKDGPVRFCIDFRKLKQITEFDAEPMPNMKELLNRMPGHKYLTNMDACKGYRTSTFFTIVQIIFHFLWDHWAQCGIFENGILLMYTLEGESVKLHKCLWIVSMKPRLPFSTL